MTSTISVYDEIIKAVQAEIADFKLHDSVETDAAFMERIVIGVSKLTDAGWTSLGEGAQAWYTTAAEAINSLQPAPLVPGFVTERKETPVADVSSPVVKTEEVAKPTEAPKPAAKRGIMHRARELALLDPEKSTAVGIAAKLKEEGFEKVSEDTAWMCLSEVRNVLKAMGTAGFKVVKSEI